MTGAIRIIGGRFRGKKMAVLADQPTLRPTPNRVRETLFNWLMRDVPDSVCLDAFAGSGALGFEALSRGAQQVVMLEQDTAVFQQLQKTAASFQEVPLTLLHQNTLTYLKQTQQRFDIIFLDPPFHSTLLPGCLDLILQRSLLTPAGILYIESDQPFTLTDWECIRLQQAGAVHYGLFRPYATKRHPSVA